MNLSEFYCLTNLKFVAFWDSLKTHSPAVAKGKGMDQVTWASAKRTSSTFDMGLKNLIQPSNPSGFEIWT